MLDINHHIKRLDATVYGPPATEDEITTIKNTPTIALRPDHEMLLRTLGYTAFDAVIKEIGTDWETATFRLRSAEDVLISDDLLNTDYEMPGHTALGSDDMGQPVLVDNQTGTVSVFQRTTPDGGLRIVGHSIEDFFNRLVLHEWS